MSLFSEVLAAKMLDFGATNVLGLPKPWGRPVDRAARRANPHTISDFMMTAREAGERPPQLRDDLLLGLVWEHSGKRRPGWSYRWARREAAKVTYREWRGQ